MSLLDIDKLERKSDDYVTNYIVLDFITKYYGYMAECENHKTVINGVTYSPYYEKMLISIHSFIRIRMEYIKESVIHHEYKSQQGLMDSNVFVRCISVEDNNGMSHATLDVVITPDDKYLDYGIKFNVIQLLQKTGEPIKFKHMIEFLKNYDGNKKSKHYDFFYKKYMI